MSIYKTALGIGLGAGLCFIGYCFYFDRKRRNDPAYKRNLRERRKQNRMEQRQSQNQFPKISSAEEMQKFFLQEVQTGEELLATGNIEDGVEHLSNAVAVCGQPQQLLQLLQQTLAPQVFQSLLQKLPSVSERLSSLIQPPAGAGDIAEDELE